MIPEPTRGRNGIIQRTAAERVRANVAVSASTGCHEWTGALDKKGYARVAVGGQRNKMAHRIAYEAVNGPIPDGLSLDHLCRNPRCCNPDHLEPVTLAENNRRAAAARLSEITHCRHGHEWTQENTAYTGTGGGRICKACKRYRRRAATPILALHGAIG